MSNKTPAAFALTNANPVVIAAGGSGTYTLKNVSSPDFNFTGPVTLTGASALLRGRLSPALTAEFGISYGLSDSLETLGSAALRSALFRAAVTRELSQWEFALGYDRVSQHQNGSGIGMEDTPHNRAWVSVSFQLSRPLGRN